MQRTRRASWLAIALALMLVVSACSSSSSDTTTTAGGGSTDTTAAGGGGEPVSGDVLVWTHQNDAFNGGYQTLADSFMAANPDVNITFETFDYDTYIQTLQTALPAGTAGDILQMFGTWTCSYKDNLQAVPASMGSMDAAHDIFFDAPLNGYVCGDSMYGFPQEFNIEYGATLFNETIAGETGVTGDWADWDAFTADALAMTSTTDGVILRAGYNYTSGDAIGYTFLSNIIQNGGNYVNDDRSAFTLNTPEGEAALTLMKSFVDAGIIDPVLFNDESNWVGDCFFEEACSMGLVGPWALADYAGDYPDVAAVTDYKPLPYIGETPKFVADSGWGLTVSKDSGASDAAWAFVEYVTMNAENAAGWNGVSGTLPALRSNAEGAAMDALVSDYPHFAAFFPLLPYGQYVGDLPDRDLLWYDIMYPHILNFLQGNESMADALAAMEKEANESFG